MNKYRIIGGIVLIVMGWNLLSAQPNQPAFQLVSPVFQSTQDGIISGDVKSFSQYLAKQVYLDLPGEERRYCSANQAFLILQNFFGSRKTVQFKFSTVDQSDAGSFATGSGTFLLRGRREALQIYVFISKADNNFVISQFNVY